MQGLGAHMPEGMQCRCSCLQCIAALLLGSDRHHHRHRHPRAFEGTCPLLFWRLASGKSANNGNGQGHGNGKGKGAPCKHD
mmetsp:Transcript_41950/g.90074  ORF Transcript_41950/g.90074 Transcript_41950/m.90074 type:complete len:81 (+) Transcript_41950:122-364(+)